MDDEEQTRLVEVGEAGRTVYFFHVVTAKTRPVVYRVLADDADAATEKYLRRLSVKWNLANHHLQQHGQEPLSLAVLGADPFATISLTGRRQDIVAWPICSAFLRLPDHRQAEILLSIREQWGSEFEHFVLTGAMPE